MCITLGGGYMDTKLYGLLKQYWRSGYKLNQIEELLFGEGFDMNQEEIQANFKVMFLNELEGNKYAN